MAKKERTLLQQLIEEHQLKSVADVHEFVKMLTAETIQQMLDNELTDHLGYTKHDISAKETTNSRNGHSKKTVQSSMGEMELDIPRDRNGEFEPQAVKKYQTDISDIENKIIFMFSQGTSTRDIQKTMREIYGIEVDDSRVSRITDKILPLIKAWQERPLESVYAMVMLDALHLDIRTDGVVTKKAVYIILGTTLEGRKDVLNICIGASESSKYWLNVLTGLQNRGVKDILIASVDGLSGFVEAINAAFPKTEVQRCIVHQIRSCSKYVSYKDIKQFTSDLKPIYKAATEELGLAALDEFEQKWGSKYGVSVRSWRNNWNELATMFKYPSEIRKLIYTTNAIENFNRQIRKVTKTKGAFVSDDAAMKLLYLATMNITEKWTMPLADWGLILNHLAIYFGDRVKV